MPVQVLGVGELVGRMKALPDKLRNKGMRTAMKQAARPIVQATKAMAPVQTGLLRQSIASVVVKSKDSFSALIGMRHVTGGKNKGFRPSKKVVRAIVARVAGGGSSREGDPARYAHLVEFGHNIVPRGQKVGRKERKGKTAVELGVSRGFGRVAARPFMRPGLASGAQAAEQALAQELRQFLAQEAGK